MQTRRRFFGLFPALAGAALVAKAESTTAPVQIKSLRAIQGASATLIQGEPYQHGQQATLPLGPGGPNDSLITRQELQSAIASAMGATSACPHAEIVETTYSVPQIFEAIVVQHSTSDKDQMTGMTSGYQRRCVEICLSCGALFCQVLKNEIVNQKKD